jgi:hypothetical protein
VTTQDRELLERAARAAGIELLWSSEPGWAPKFKGERMQSWNPLDDDGDAFRLCVRLEIGAQHHHHGIGWVDAGTLNVGWFKELIGGDPYGATRRAIVRAAAAMDKAQ